MESKRCSHLSSSGQDVSRPSLLQRHSPGGGPPACLFQGGKLLLGYQASTFSSCQPEPNEEILVPWGHSLNGLRAKGRSLLNIFPPGRLSHSAQAQLGRELQQHQEDVVPEEERMTPSAESPCACAQHSPHSPLPSELRSMSCMQNMGDTNYDISSQETK